MTLGKRILSSSLWMLGWQWLGRLLGVVSLIILARILTPDDYGIIFKATVIIAFIEIVTVLGVEKYIINHPAPNKEIYDTAWTLKLIQYTVIAIILFMLSPLASEFMGEPAVKDVLLVMSVGVFLTGLENIGIVKFQKDLLFKKMFYFGLSKRLFGFFATLTAAFLLKTYWALVIGFVATRFSGVILSYLLSDYRPRLVLEGIRKQWDFTKWILLDNVAVYFRNKSDMLIVAQLFGTKDVGIYGMSVNLADLPTTEVVTPLFSALYPGLATVKDDKKEFASKVLMILGVLSIIMFPIMFGIVLVSEEIIFIALGEKWIKTVHLLDWLVCLGVFWFVSSLATTVLQIKDKVQYATYLNWLLVSILVPALFYGAYFGELYLVVVSKVVVSYVILPIYMVVLCRVAEIKITEVLRYFYRPLAASIIMYILVEYIIGFVSDQYIFLFLTKVLLGALCYSTVLYILWVLAKKPYSSEKYILDNIILPTFKKLRINKT